MAGRKKTYQVELTVDERERLERIVASRKSAQSEAQRARVVLACAVHPDWRDGCVAEQAGCSSGMVRKWRKRWAETHSLQELPRPGRPRRFPPTGAGAGDGAGLWLAE